jgi:hypothetical protein
VLCSTHPPCWCWSFLYDVIVNTREEGRGGSRLATHSQSVFTIYGWFERLPYLWCLAPGSVPHWSVPHWSGSDLVRPRSSCERKGMTDNCMFFCIADTRTPIYNRIIAKFNGTIKNRKGDESHYFENLMTYKFVLAPSGLGLDSKLSCWALCYPCF